MGEVHNDQPGACVYSRKALSAELLAQHLGSSAASLLGCYFYQCDTSLVKAQLIDWFGPNTDFSY